MIRALRANGPQAQVLPGQRLRVEPLRPAARQVTADRAGDAGRAGDLAAVGEDAAMGEMRKTAVVVDMQVSQHDRFHIALADAKASQLRSDFLLWLDVEAHRKLEIGVPARQRFQVRARSGIDHDDALGMLDRPGIDRHPFRPFARDNRLNLPPETVSAAFDLRLFDLHAAGLDGVDAHCAFSLGQNASAAADAAEMRVAEAGRVFQAITERPVEADMRDPDQGAGHRRRQTGNEFERAESVSGST